MIKKEAEKIFDYLKVIQTVYNRFSWDNQRAKPISIETISKTRIFLTNLITQLGLDNIPKPEDVYPMTNGNIGIDWVKFVDNKLDVFVIEIGKNGSLKYYSYLDSLGTTFEKETVISEIIEEMMIIHLKHFQ